MARTKSAAKAGDTATYVYGFVASAQRPALDDAPPGLDGAGPLRVIDGGDGLWIVASDVPLVAYEARAIEARLHDLDWVSARAVEHERVVEHAMQRGDLVPAKLFTLFFDDGRAAAFVEERRSSFQGILARVGGCQEWGVRLSVDLAKARKRAEARAEEGAAGPRTGAAYLLAKKGRRDASREVTGDVASCADDVFGRLAPLAREAKKRPIAAQGGGARVVLDAALLVERRREAVFEATLAEVAKELSPDGYDLVVTGPWPPYHFIEDAT